MNLNTTQASKLRKLQDRIQDKFLSNLSSKEMDRGKGFSSCAHSTTSLKDNAIMSVHLQPCTQGCDEGLFIVLNPKVTPWRRIGLPVQSTVIKLPSTSQLGKRVHYECSSKLMKTQKMLKSISSAAVDITYRLKQEYILQSCLGFFLNH